MKDLHRIPLVAIILIVLLRMSIGWQFLYEGLWKKATLDTPTPWSSEGYLKNAQGPLRNYFRNMTGDPDDLKWLDYAEVSKRWYDWRDRFAAHYQLDENQLKVLNQQLDGDPAQDTAIDELPPSIRVTQKPVELPAALEGKNLGPAFRYDAASKSLSAVAPVLPSEEASILELLDVHRNPDGQFVRESDSTQQPDGTELEFYRALERLAFQSRQLSYRHKLAAALRGDPEKVGVTSVANERGSFDVTMGTATADEIGAEKNLLRYGTIQEYKDLVKDYNRSVDEAKMAFQNDHATMLGRKVALMRNELVGPIKAMDASLRDAAMKILTPEQLNLGQLPPVQTPLYKADMQVMWALIILGGLLIIGLASRIAAIGGAILLFMFYLVMPPWPGVPPVPGPEHSLIINKNLIESLALLAIAALPTGTWFGVDALFYSLFRRKPAAAPATAAKPVPAPAKS